MDLEMMGIMVGICEYEGIPYEPITDLGVIMKHVRGKMNPCCACGIYVFPNDPDYKQILTNFYQLIQYIERNGLPI